METILKDCLAGILIRSEVEKAAVSLYTQVKNPIADGANLEKVELRNGEKHAEAKKTCSLTFHYMR